MPVSPILERQTTYPFVRLNEAARRVEARGIDVIDFGIGDPREPTDPKIRQALVDGLRDRMGYPAAVGLPELREAIAAWAESRFGAALDPDTEIIPTLGSKEAIFTFALAVVDVDGARDTVAYTDPGYPVYERGALFAHARPLALPLREEQGFLPDLDAIDDETWSRLAVFWINYPNNPTAATAPLSFYERLAALAREHGFVVASDEAYTELWFDEPPASALQLTDRTNVVVFNTLSKRSSMTGYRSGFAAGDPDLIAALKAFRPTVGTAPQEFVQRASVVAWGDEEHVAETRARYGRKRALFLDLFARKGVRVAGSAATMYIWAEVPEGETSESFAERLLEHGVLVTPGSYLGTAGEGYFRVALVPSEDGVRPRRRDPGARAVTPELALEIVEALDKGERRVASPDGDGWVVDVEAKEAILEYFRLRKVEPMTVGPFSFQDKIPLKVPPNGVRIVPPGVARYGSFLSDGVVLMPGYVNIGAWVGPRTMVDTWATVGSCAQIGADVHLAGGVGIGGVLEPPNATPVIVEDGAFLGSRCIVTEGVRIGAGAVLSANVSLTASVPIIDVTGDEPVEHRGSVPPRAVVVPGTRPKEFPAGTYQLDCALIIGWRKESHDERLSLNETLREFELAV